MTSEAPLAPRWVRNLLTKRANKPLMASEDSKKAAASTGWKAKRFWEKRDTTHYAHNALQQMGVPKGHVLYDRLYKSLTDGVNLAEVTKTELIAHLGLDQRLRSAEMQLTMDDIISIYVLGEKSSELDRMLTGVPAPAAGHDGTVHSVPGPAGSLRQPSPVRDHEIAARGSVDKKRPRSETASPAPASKKAATCKSTIEAAQFLSAHDPDGQGNSSAPEDDGVKQGGTSEPAVQPSIFIYDSDDSDQL